mmetsp:Transcript_7998/g.10633  ORF Transcript_7998/g.10633 Transcript_7998/m.10633 type:complete len:320 (+) Transcript_7998:57-1016(+)|eukprot:CAMPEP_0117757508 /NCGR_PEP_ID=MMETSP0947-20121206/14780_1 /TAXON_ID=44440 /ORGANISM="Chattonella subsalsa, Strain CCMP2191" /LENGTH=319 /DNA_ID=CAMNT_0005577429 /DNA_START=50 /DNA_END=1009 /DNA_ORIENTATION=-
MNAAATPNRRQEENVEFTVKAYEDLVLEGSERSIIRVRANAPYSCLMLKNQRFSSLFRHYAKHHGLRKEDLAYYFTEELQNDDTPESVYLQRNDEIIVRKRRPPKPPEPEICPVSKFFEHMAMLMHDKEHMDVTILVGPDAVEVKAHKAILVGRSDCFRATFRKGGMKESENGILSMESHDVATVSRMLEFLYTNKIQHISTCSPEELLSLLIVAEEKLLPELKALCENEASKLISVENCAKMLSTAESYNAPQLKEACISFILDNVGEVTDDLGFQKELEQSPHLFVPLLKATASLIPPAAKRRRTGETIYLDEGISS